MVTYSIKSGSDNVSDEPHLEIYLKKDDFGRLYIMAVEESGKEWYVANFTKDGSLRLVPDIEASSMLNVDCYGCIKISSGR